MSTRTETDSLGEVSLPEHALYQAQTQRALNNFSISGRTLPAPFYTALAQLKWACARVNGKDGKLEGSKARAIESVALDIVRGKHREALCVDVFQTGSGTSSNMNINEVIATLASRELGQQVHPNNHVNMSQSSNDVIPSALQLSLAARVADSLLPALVQCEHAIAHTASRLSQHIKTGRTHLMDAMPISLGDELLTFAVQLQDACAGIEGRLPPLLALPIGGSAIGTGINTAADFGERVCQQLNQQWGIKVTSAANKASRMAAQDVTVAMLGQLTVLATALMKIANDLRWMNSGPLAGLGEIRLVPVQPGSSIMPGKVNPVQLEAICMIAAKVMGLNQTSIIAGQSGSFQLNTMLPLLADVGLEAVLLLTRAAELLEQVVNGIEVNQEHIARTLSQNPILVTALNEHIGYDLAAKIAKVAYQSGRPILEVAEQMTDLGKEELTALLDPRHLARPHD